MAAPAYVGTFTYIGANASSASGNRVYAGGSLVVRISTQTASTTLNTLTYGGIDLLPYLEAQVNNTLRMWLFVVPASALSSLTPTTSYSFNAGWSGTTSVGYGLAEYTGTIYDVIVQAQVYAGSGSTVVDTLDLPADSTTIQDVIWNVSSGGTTPNSSQNERDDRGGGGVVRAYYDFSTASDLAAHVLQLTQTNVAHAHISVTLLGAAPSGGTDDLDADDLDVEVELDEPALGQVHALIGVDLSATVQLDAPGLGQVHALTPIEVSVGAQLDVPSLGQVHTLSPSDLDFEVELDVPALVASFDPIQVAGIIACWDVDDVVGGPTPDRAYSIPDRAGGEDEVANTVDGSRLTTITADADFNGHTSLNGTGSRYLRKTPLAGGNLSQPYTIYAVVRTGSDITADQYIVGSGDPAGRFDLRVNAGRLGCRTGLSNEVFTAASLTINTLGIAKSVYNGSNFEVEWSPSGESVLYATGAGNSSAGIGITLMNSPLATAIFRGKSAYFLLYSGVVSGTDDAKIKSFLRDRFGMPTPIVGQGLDVGVTLDTPTLGQVHALVGQDFNVGPALDTPALGQAHALGGDDLSVEAELDVPALGIIHNLVGSDLTVGVVLDAPLLREIHLLVATDLSIAVLLDSPLLGIGGADQIYPVTYSHRPGKSLTYGHTPGQSLSYSWREQS